MRVAIVVAGLPPVYNGGTEIATVAIAKYAVRARHDVHVVALDGTGKGATEYAALQKEHGFTVHRVAAIPGPYLYSLSATPAAALTIARIRPGLVHAQGMLTAPTAIIGSRIAGASLLVYGRGEIYVNWLCKASVHRLVLHAASRVVAQTEHMKSAMLEYCSRDIEVIPNGIDVTRFGKLSKAQARELLDLPQDRKIVVFVGQFRSEKNPLLFVDIALRNTDVLHIAVGGGAMLSQAKSYAADSGCANIIFTGDLPNDRVLSYLHAADVLVNTSNSEGFPVSILEAMASGLPIVAPRVCGIPEIIEDEVNGKLVPLGDAVLSYLAVRSILQDDTLAATMAACNRIKASQYSWESVVRKLYGVA